MWCVLLGQLKNAFFAFLRRLCSAEVLEGPLRNPHIGTPRKSQALVFCCDRGSQWLREHQLSKKTLPLFFNFSLHALSLEAPEAGKEEWQSEKERQGRYQQVPSCGSR